MMKVGRSLAVAFLCSLGLLGCRGNEIPVPLRVIDLSPPISPDINIQRLGSRTLDFLGTDGRTITAPVLPQDPAFAYGLQTLQILTHTGAHLDAPARLLRGGQPPAGVDIDKLFGQARVVDLRWHNRHAPIQITDLELKPIEEDEIVILFIGYEPPVGDAWPSFASLSSQAAEWLVAKRIRALGTDMPAIACFESIEDRLKQRLPPEKVWAEYLPFFQAQIPVVEGLVNLDLIVREPKVAFVAFPLPLTHANGSPLRAAALIY